MDPATQRLNDSPRDLRTDAFYEVDRSDEAVTREVSLNELNASGNVKKETSEVPVAFPGFASRHVIQRFESINPLSHKRRTKLKQIDMKRRSWKQKVVYNFIFSKSASQIIRSDPQARIAVKLLFGTGSEAHRHGVAATVEFAANATLLIIVEGVEPSTDFDYFDPDSAEATEPVSLTSNNRWGIGITAQTISDIIVMEFFRPVPFDVVLCAAYSTGYLGLQDSVAQILFPIDKIRRVIIFDCLYATLKGALDRIRNASRDVEIVCYVVTPGGNSFRRLPKIFANLALGSNPDWLFINLMGNFWYNAIGSAHVIEAAIAPGNVIIDTLPAPYLKDLTEFLAVAPKRGTLVSDRRIYQKLAGAIPSDKTVLSDFASDKDNTAKTVAFFKHVAFTRKCLRRAQLMGWATPAGEEWHDLTIAEFGWEYLT